MNDYITDLYNYICENTPPLRNDPEYQQAVQAYMEIEEEVKEKIGNELLCKYQCAESAVSFQSDIAIFSQTLRFGCRFMLEILGS